MKYHREELATLGGNDGRAIQVRDNTNAKTKWMDLDKPTFEAIAVLLSNMGGPEEFEFQYDLQEMIDAFKRRGPKCTRNNLAFIAGYAACLKTQGIAFRNVGEFSALIAQLEVELKIKEELQS